MFNEFKYDRYSITQEQYQAADNSLFENIRNNDSHLLYADDYSF